MSRDMETAMYSINDVLDALAKIKMAGSESAEDLASELTGLSIDSLWQLGQERPPVYFIHNIEWETDGYSTDELGLPETCFVRTCSEDSLADDLSDATGFLVCNFRSAHTSLEDLRNHVLNILFKKGYDKRRAEEFLVRTNVLNNNKVVTDSIVFDLIKEDKDHI